jgi:tRNA pseudouridine55 synthase
MASRWRRVDGVLAVDKPAGPSSTTVLQHLRRLYQAEKAGHGGTLDPAASGLLVVLFGEAAKFSQWQLGGGKTYTGVIRLGVTTTTDDAQGEVLHRQAASVDGIDLAALAARFTGTLRQRPPAFSALKREGRPLYEYARAGETVEIAEREVRISRLKLTPGGQERLAFEVDCGGGTYIRSLARDIGEALGCGAHLESLRRTRAGGVGVDEAVQVAQVEATDDAGRASLLLPPDRLLAGLPALVLAEEEALALSAGRRVPAPGGATLGISRTYGPGARFLGVAEVTDTGLLVARRLMAAPASGTPR